ncbi:MAG: DUF4010 domain-containing protein [Gammaproteobacteria bacterium]|jgi:uncharacterized membrane protein (DUF4010 family)|nr:DUF4010 domain-containing protein [Gammaproteobacteria bacterium]
MTPQLLLQLFFQFGLAGLIGFLLGIEREMSAKNSDSIGGRDFVLFAIVGAAAAYVALHYDMPWLVPAAFVAVVVLVVSRYWKDDEQGPGITTEAAAVLTFLLGVLVMHGAREIAIALAILTFALLAHKREIKSFRAHIKSRDIQATLKFLVIAFIVLPVLPRESLDNYAEFQVGSLASVDASAGEVTIQLLEGHTLEPGDQVSIAPPSGEQIDGVRIVGEAGKRVVGKLPADFPQNLAAGANVYAPLGIEFVRVLLSAIKPYNLWLIVILVSLISFIGYILIKLMGSGIGVGLTGLVGGLISSTVTTLSFSRRSQERPELNRSFSVAILLASAMMFPRLLIEMFVVNQPLAISVALPLMLMGATGFAIAFLRFFRTQHSESKAGPVEFDNPFSLTAAVTFGLIFAAILMLTRTATHYLGDAWLPAVALISGLTDADAIAFSVSDAHQSEWISLRWASFNLVLGAIANTLMKLALVFFLAERSLFRSLVAPFAVIGGVGLITIFVYYGFVPGIG